MITSKKLLKQKKISHGFFNMSGGKSVGIYKSLNCGTGSMDKDYKVKQNLKIVKNQIGKKTKDIFLVRQNHTSKYIFLNKNFKFYKKKIEADAIITNQRNLPIGILTADCVPLLLYDKKKNLIAIVHAGWKGAFKGIVKKVINFMFKKGCSGKSITAVIGPCIAQKSYEVKKDFFKKFVKNDRKNKLFFQIQNGMFFFDLSKFIESQVKNYKITNIDRIKIDTFDKKNNFFSARRSLKLKHDDYGRNISIIMIN